MMESALAILIDRGELSRHIKRSKKIYAGRLELAARLIANSLAPAVTFYKPQGGMALWLQFDDRYPLASVLSKASSKNLHLNGSAYFEGHNDNYNSIRFGFASLQEQQLEQAVRVLANILS